MLTGTLHRRDGAWFVDYTTTQSNAPALLTTSWRVTGTRALAPYGPAPEMVDGLEVTWEFGRAWQAYAHGSYLILDTDDNGQQTTAPFPCPRVRAGVETRYHYGRWEKCSARLGWIPAGARS